MRIFITIVAVCVAVLAVFSYLGAWHPAGDSFAVIRYPLVAALFALAALRFRARIAQIVMLVCAGLLADRAMMMRSTDAPESSDIVIYQKNMLYRDYDAASLAQDIWVSGARVVTLQEVSSAHDDFLSIMADTHPYQLVCKGPSVGAIAILSTDISVRQTCSDPVGIAVMDIAAQDGQLLTRVVSLHLHWPWPHRQSDRLDAMLAFLDSATLNELGVPDRVVVGGDFNMVPWGQSLRRVQDTFGVARVGHVERTFELFGWPLSIDHVMAGPAATGQIEVHPQLGSDHFGVIGRIAFSAP